jgi:hypothetical protein
VGATGKAREREQDATIYYQHYTYLESTLPAKINKDMYYCTCRVLLKQDCHADTKCSILT